MKILISIGYISEHAILIQFYIILPDLLQLIQPALDVMKNNW